MEKYAEQLADMTIEQLLEELILLVQLKDEPRRIMMVKEEITLRVPI
jgi:hypothetical protein